jgi:hypothetical protein
MSFDPTGGILATVTKTQSYSLVIRDAFHDALKADPFFAGYTVRKTRMLPAQANLLPYLGVYIADELMEPDGDINASEIRFIHTLRIGFSVILANNDQVVGEQQADAAYWKIMNTLWTDADLTNMVLRSMVDNTRIEGIQRGTRRHVFGTTGTNNETPIIEMQYDASCRYRTMWWPDITDTFDTLDVKTGIKIGDTQAEMDQRQQVEVLYDLTKMSKQPNWFDRWKVWRRDQQKKEKR